MVLVFKTKVGKKPGFLSKTFSKVFAYKTRAATTNKIVQNQKPKSEETRKAFVYRSLMEWNMLPVEIRQIEKLEKFKIELKTWIKANVEI